MSPQRKATILIIDDEESVRDTLVDMLELNGFSTQVATNGVEGLAIAQRETPSLIITDVSMPGMSGFELLDEFRGDAGLRTIPVIVISARSERAAARRGMELGAADFISKPFTEDEVIRSVATRLEKKALVDELDAFAHTVAHDLKNPLCTLAGRISLLGEMLGQTDEATLRHQITQASQSARQLNGIVEELLLLAGVRRQAAMPVPLDTSALVTEALDRLDHHLRGQSARIQRPETWPAALGHAPWIVHVWVNYISNAAKYGGPNPNISLGAETSADGFSARFWVQDEGPGLDEDAQERLFVPFTRMSDLRSNGHGQGLSIVRRIVEKLDGQVGVISSPGAGARFWFELPTPLPPASSLLPWATSTT